MMITKVMRRVFLAIMVFEVVACCALVSMAWFISLALMVGAPPHAALTMWSAIVIAGASGWTVATLGDMVARGYLRWTKLRERRRAWPVARVVR